MKKQKRRVYVLEGKTEENIAMAMAVTSRSPEPFDKILSQIDEKKSSNFLEKFYITYGHGSIADTAFIHIAIENISQLAIKALENSRLAAYQEKSTRYQILSREFTFEPDEIVNSKHHELFIKTINDLYDLYDEFVEKLLEQARSKNKKKVGESEGAYENRIRIPVIDRCRLILPIATMGNVGMTMSGREVEYTISKLLSHPLSEARSLGEEIKKVAIAKLPILVKFTEPIKYQMKLEKELRGESARIAGISSGKNYKLNDADLVKYDKDALERVLVGVLARFSQKSYRDIEKKVRNMSLKQREKLFDRVVGDRKMRHDKPLRELELADYTFDITVDYGAFRDLQRHRMVSQTVQLVTPGLGYSEPLDLEETGLAEKYHKQMAEAEAAYKIIAKNKPFEAQYILPMAYKMRMIMHLNLREAIYLIELRSRPAGHISYRRIAWQMWDEINRVHPYFAKHIKVDFSGRADAEKR